MYRSQVSRTMSSSSSSGVSLTPSDSAKEYIKDNWFGEKVQLWPGQKFCIEVDKVLLNGRSDFQDILVFESVSYGRVLVLDGVIQVTERDEFAYQEMIAHLPLFAHKRPQKVLIIGGGDGGVLREVVKHSCVETIHMCEIDRQVVEVGKAYFSESMSTAFDDPRVTLLYDDAARYLREEGRGQGYDVIICDSSDPVGPAETLFRPEFFLSMREAISADGIVCTQGECVWLHLDLIANVTAECRKLFGSVRYAYCTIPTYPSGQIGFIISSSNAQNSLAEPCRPVDVAMKASLRYYNADVHRASFVLPAFATDKLC